MSRHCDERQRPGDPEAFEAAGGGIAAAPAATRPGRWRIASAACAWSALLVLSVASGPASSQAYPTKPIRMIVAQAAGGPTDVVTRLVATKLTEQLGQQIVVDNRVGAGGTIAGEIVSHAPADGYTLCVMANGTAAIAPHLMKVNFSIDKDFAPVALIGDSPLALMVNPKLPAHSLQELIALARAKPGTINFGSSGNGSTGQLASEMLKMMTHIDITHVPYKGAAPALVAVAAGEIQMLSSGLSSGLAFIRSGQVRALGVTGKKRVAALPDVPAIGEIVPGYEASSWYAIFTRAGTPRAIVDRLNREAATAIDTPDLHAKLIAASVEPDTLTPEALRAKIRSDSERWGKVVKAAGLARR
jgi:tripartite-type tricarboxylate transporter receptor subunit TctC